MTDEEYFTRGRCYELALALHRRTGWPLAHVCGARNCHAMVRTPDRGFLDIFGIQSKSDVRERWGPEAIVRCATPSFFDDWTVGISYPHDQKRLQRATRRLLACKEIRALREGESSGPRREGEAKA